MAKCASVAACRYLSTSKAIMPRTGQGDTIVDAHKPMDVLGIESGSMKVRILIHGRVCVDALVEDGTIVTKICFAAGRNQFTL